MTFQGTLRVDVKNEFIRGLHPAEARLKVAQYFDEIFARAGESYDDDLGISYSFDLHEESPESQHLRQVAKDLLAAEDELKVDDDAGVSLIEDPEEMGIEADLAGHVQVWHYVEVPGG